MTRQRRPAGRTAFMWLLWALTALLLIAGVAAAVGAAAGRSGPGADGGLAFVFLLALGAGSGAWAAGRGGRQGTSADWLPAEAAVPSRGLPAPAGAADEPAQVPLAGLPPADPAVSYRERHSQFPVAGGPVALGLLAGSLTGLVIVGGPNSRGYGPLGGLLVLLVVLTVVFVILVLADWPNGIDIEGGRFTVGVQNGRPRGRLRRRVSGPLAAVGSWDVLTPAQVRGLHQHRPVRSTSGRPLQYLGDLRMLGRSGVLRLVVPPGSVQASFPARVLAGYTVVRAAQAGAIWDGVILICTRRPAALAAALERALPGRRATGSGAAAAPGQGIRS
jgi:hypothetical protein